MKPWFKEREIFGFFSNVRSERFSSACFVVNFVVNFDVVLFCPWGLWPCVVKIGFGVGSVELSISV